MKEPKDKLYERGSTAVLLLCLGLFWGSGMLIGAALKEVAPLNMQQKQTAFLSARYQCVVGFGGELEPLPKGRYDVEK